MLLVNRKTDLQKEGQYSFACGMLLLTHSDRKKLPSWTVVILHPITTTMLIAMFSSPLGSPLLCFFVVFMYFITYVLLLLLGTFYAAPMYLLLSSGSNNRLWENNSIVVSVRLTCSFSVWQTPESAGYCVMSNIARARNQWYTKDSVFWLAQMTLYIMV